MNIQAPINENYAATVATITTTIDIGCKYIHLAIINGVNVIVSKQYGVGTKGLLFPVGTRLSFDFLSYNNLYRSPHRNRDKNEIGYFESDGKVRAINLNGYKSAGFFSPLKSLLYISLAEELATLQERDIFDRIYGVEICSKYVPKVKKMLPSPTSFNTYRRRARALLQSCG